MEGTTGIGGVTADVDASFEDILDNLEMGFMGMYRGTRDRFSIDVDTIFMGLGATEGSRPGLAKADIDVDQFVLGAAAGYALTEKFVVLGGLRYYDLSAEVKVTDPLGNTADAETDESWVDPYIGARYTIPLSEAWSLNLSGDIGASVLARTSRGRAWSLSAGSSRSEPVRWPHIVTWTWTTKRQRFQPLRVRHGLLGPGARNRVHVLKGRAGAGRRLERPTSGIDRTHGSVHRGRREVAGLERPAQLDQHRQQDRLLAREQLGELPDQRFALLRELVRQRLGHRGETLGRRGDYEKADVVVRAGVPMAAQADYLDVIGFKMNPAAPWVSTSRSSRTSATSGRMHEATR